MNDFVITCDRGGHLHNSKMLLKKLDIVPKAIVTTMGPEIFPLRQKYTVFVIPYIFTWFGKIRFFDPFKSFLNLIISFWLALKLRPKTIISFGATNVVFFCYFGKLFGSKIIHVECMNQVKSKSCAGKFLYPISNHFFVQWEDLLPLYGKKAKYEGWVL